MMKKYIFLIFVFLLTTFITAHDSYGAFVTPTRIFIQDGRSSASVSISNTSDETVVYTFEWERRVKTDGGNKTILLGEDETHETYRPADPYLIYSPRRVVVEPGETQRLRILARRPVDMAPGEYRSHLKITSDRIGEPEKIPASRGQFAGTMAIRSAVSIPIMLRTGKTVIDIVSTGHKIVREGLVDVVHLSLQNNSTRSIYGRSQFKCFLPGASEPTVTRSNGFRLYYETKARLKRINVPDSALLSDCASLELELYSIRDPDYRNMPIVSVKIK